MNQSLGWAEFPLHYGIRDILRLGDIFPKKIVNNIQNKFWKDMVHGIIKLNEVLKFN